MNDRNFSSSDEAELPRHVAPPCALIAFTLIPLPLYIALSLSLSFGPPPPFPFPYLGLLLLLIALLCISLDFVAIKIIWKQTTRVGEVHLWLWAYGVHFNPFLIGLDLFVWRGMKILQIEDVIKIPVALGFLAFLCLSYFTATAALMRWKWRAEDEDAWEAEFPGERIQLLRREMVEVEGR